MRDKFTRAEYGLGEAQQRLMGAEKQIERYIAQKAKGAKEEEEIEASKTVKFEGDQPAAGAKPKKKAKAKKGKK